MKDDHVVRLQIEYKLLSRRDSGAYELAVIKEVLSAETAGGYE